MNLTKYLSDNGLIKVVKHGIIEKIKHFHFRKPRVEDNIVVNHSKTNDMVFELRHFIQQNESARR